VKPYHEDIAEIEVLTEVVMATLFGFLYRPRGTLAPNGEYH